MRRHMGPLVGFLLAAACGDDLSPPGPALVASRPAAGADVQVGEPIELRFELPVDPATLDATTVQISSPAGQLAYDLAVSADGALLVTIEDPPPLPATIEVRVTSGLRFVGAAGGFTGDPLTYEVPLWFDVTAEADGSGRPTVAIDGAGALWAAWETAGRLELARRERDGWTVVATRPLELAELPLGAAPLDLAVGADGPVIGWGAGLVRWDGDALVDIARPPGAAALDPDGAVVAIATAAELQLHDLIDGELVARGAAIAAAGAGAPAVAVVGDQAVVARVDDAGDLALYREADGQLALVDAVRDGAASDPAIAGLPGGGGVLVLWHSEGDVRSAGLATGDPTAVPGPALDVDLARRATSPELASGGGQLIAAWSEADEDGGDELYVARRGPAGFTVLGGRLAADASFDLAVDGHGEPIAMWREDLAVSEGPAIGARWNRSPVLPFGLPPRAGAGCALPDPPPDSLAATGCYADLAAGTMAAGFVPFDVAAPLWSDGAAKRRFLFLPEGTTMGFEATAAFTMPVGAIVAKEFALEDPQLGRVTIETRFLVKRCEEGQCVEPWQGYTYVWSEAGDDATRHSGDDPLTVAWTLNDPDGDGEVVHPHVYPASADCATCHTRAAGRVLGLQGWQLAGAFDYGDVVDRQLRALAAAGLFAAPPDDDRTPTERLPRPADRGETVEHRARAYLHANCSQCHRGFAAPMDLRFNVKLADTDLCPRLDLDDPAASTAIVRASTRGAGQMPPLATLAPDTGALATLTTWIDGLAACP